LELGHFPSSSFGDSGKIVLYPGEYFPAGNKAFKDLVESPKKIEIQDCANAQVGFLKLAYLLSNVQWRSW